MAIKTTSDAGRDARRDMLCAKCGAKCRAQNVRRKMSICRVGHRSESFFAVC